MPSEGTTARSRSRNFVFTWNNYDASSEHVIETTKTSFKYILYGREVAPTTGTPHLQGYFSLATGKTISACQSFLRDLGWICSIQPARGDWKSNWDYCTKTDNNPFQFGVPPTCQGKRTDLHDCCDLIATGVPIEEVLQSHPTVFLKYPKGIRELVLFRSPPRDFKTRVEWYWGPTGTGKSRLAWEQHPTAFSKDPSSEWWDGYTGQDTVILDDYRPSPKLPFNQLLRLFDRYPLSVQVKGGTVQFNSKLIVVTTQKHPEDTFTHLEFIHNEDLQQLMRRIENCQEFKLTFN